MNLMIRWVRVFDYALAFGLGVTGITLLLFGHLETGLWVTGTAAISTLMALLQPAVWVERKIRASMIRRPEST